MHHKLADFIVRHVNVTACSKPGLPFKHRMCIFAFLP